MFSTISMKKPPIFLLSLALLMLFSLSACDSTPPKLMKASKQFETDEMRDKHAAYMRINHMDVLMHKRDQTMYEGIRTKKGSLKACINCHVPEKHNGEVLRHTNPEHFCSTCHGYVAAQLDCFECHADHPARQNKTTASVNPHSSLEGSLVQSLEQPDLPKVTTEIPEVGKRNDQSLAQNESDKSLELNVGSSISQVVLGGAASE